MTPDLKPKWIFFDLDGTLSDSLEALYKAYEGFLARYDRTGSREEFCLLNGPSFDEIIDHLRRAHQLEEHSPERMMTDFRAGILQAFMQDLQPMAGADETLSRLSARGIRLMLVTAGSRDEVMQVLRRFNWQDRFEAIITGDMVTRAKPDPAIYLKALERSKAEAHQVLVVEDAPHGVEAAQAAGLQVVCIANQLCPLSDEQKKGASCIRALPEIFQILG
ncbi:MAG: HAD family hydrolase [Magnetococcales bacterium]|nr:HAD family hydrolase [Magnetococcales bacterium]